MKLFKAFALAFNMMSIIPFFKVHNFYKGINGYSAMFYPLIGFILGSVLWATHTLLNPYLPSIHLSVLIFSLWILISGALHLDGFSDTVDGLFVSKEKSLQVMKDSHVGGMGMSFTVVFLALKLSSIIYLGIYNLIYLLPIVLMLSRLNATLAIYFYKYISSGVGALIKKELKIVHILFALLYTLAIAFYFNSLVLFILSSFVLVLCAHFFTRRLSGLNGDIYGFIIELTELLLLNYLIILHFS